jgi:hypothetical protein
LVRTDLSIGKLPILKPENLPCAQNSSPHKNAARHAIGKPKALNSRLINRRTNEAAKAG